MNDRISLLIPTHNRHHYLERALAYYGTAGFRIYVVDSTAAAYDRKGAENITYFHLPGVSLTGKIAAALEVIQTPYIVMCADDDFLVPASVLECLHFLDTHPAYAAAAGNSICYRKNSIATGRVDFAAIYNSRLSYEVTAATPFERIKAFFNPYRGAFYAVHRTATLRKAFEGAAMVVQNLFLNEYLTALYPLATGAFIELPVLYHIREYADDSGDKTTLNLDALFSDTAFKKEYENFIAHQAVLVAQVTGLAAGDCKAQLQAVLDGYARQIHQGKYLPAAGAEKKIGAIVKSIPVAGNKLIQAYRKYRAQKTLGLFVRTAADNACLEKLNLLILQYNKPN